MIENVISEINATIMASFHFEMALYKYEKNNFLTVVGSEDLLYYHTLEIYFDDVLLIVGKVDFRADSTKPVLYLLTDKEFNMKHGVEQGYNVFYFLDDDGRHIYIAAKGIAYKIHTVKYVK